MGFRRSLVAAFVVVAVVPSAADAAEVRIVARDVALRTPAPGVRETVARTAPLSFDMVGLHWRGLGRVWFRTAGRAGSWSAWQPARPEAEDQPDRGTAEARAAAGWKLGNPYWTGPAARIQYRVSGRITRLRAYFIASPVSTRARTLARPRTPGIIRRADWGADESIVRATPSYAERLRFAVVHHTAGTNSYTAAQSAAIVRGIQRYHVLSNGWNDIGYNFLVDKYGQVFEGRGGGVARNVVGAHAQGFNTGSVGVAVLGTYQAEGIPSRARAAVGRLLAWRLDVAHVDPLSSLTFGSYGNERFPAGTKVRLRAVSGHRDTGSTSCPGASLYGQLPRLARAVAATGLPKLYEPRVRGSLGQPVRFTARLSSAASWTVTVKNGAGAVVAQGIGTGADVDWTWDSSAAAQDRYSYVIAAGSDARPASGIVPGPPPLAVLRARAAPSVITPNGDRNADRLRVSFSVNLGSTVQVTALASGTVVKTLLPDRVVPAGPVEVGWDGTGGDGSPLPDRAYRIRVAATRDGQTAVRLLWVVVDRTVGFLTASPRAFSPNGDGRLDLVTAGFELTRPADVRVQVVRRSNPVRTILARFVSDPGRLEVRWDGLLRGGLRAGDGSYRMRVQAVTSLGTRILERRFVLDTRRPWLRVLSARVVRGVTRIWFVLSEPARVRIRYGATTWQEGGLVALNRPAGAQRVSIRARAGSIRLVPRDAAGNVGRPVVARVG